MKVNSVGKVRCVFSTAVSLIIASVCLAGRTSGQKKKTHLCKRKLLTMIKINYLKRLITQKDTDHSMRPQTHWEFDLIGVRFDRRGNNLILIWTRAWNMTVNLLEQLKSSHCSHGGCSPVCSSCDVFFFFFCPDLSAVKVVEIPPPCSSLTAALQDSAAMQREHGVNVRVWKVRSDVSNLRLPRCPTLTPPAAC